MWKLSMFILSTVPKLPPCHCPFLTRGQSTAYLKATQLQALWLSLWAWWKSHEYGVEMTCWYIFGRGLHPAKLARNAWPSINIYIYTYIHIYIYIDEDRHLDGWWGFNDGRILLKWPAPVVGCMLSQPVIQSYQHACAYIECPLNIHKNPSNPSTIPKMFQAFTIKNLKKRCTLQKISQLQDPPRSLQRRRPPDLALRRLAGRRRRFAAAIMVRYGQMLYHVVSMWWYRHISSILDWSSRFH